MLLDTRTARNGLWPAAPARREMEHASRRILASVEVLRRIGLRVTPPLPMLQGMLSPARLNHTAAPARRTASLNVTPILWNGQIPVGLHQPWRPTFAGSGSASSRTHKQERRWFVSWLARAALKDCQSLSGPHFQAHRNPSLVVHRYDGHPVAEPLAESLS
jgi:hypothetical protein